MALPPALISKRPADVAEHLAKAFQMLGASGSRTLPERVLGDVVDAFGGRHPTLRAIDMEYHDLGHTLQATVCMADLVTGQHHAGDAAGFTARTADLAVVAALLHDVGFLKERNDTAGTGAKYTLVHERRSCDFARQYLPTLDVRPAEVDMICGAISCTGPRNRIGDQTFPDASARRLACLLTTADYLSQMSAPDYPDKLDALYAEFVEAWDYEKVPASQRPFSSALALKRGTPQFWEKFVRPMLDSDADGVHRFLSVTGRANPYLEAVAANLAEIRRRLPADSAHS
jgi:hypothetical protein